MSNFFIISDTHFSHNSMLKFTKEDGTLLRPEFRDASHMDEVMIQKWNEVVRPQDHVWHLGDVAMKRDALLLVRRLNGHKRLVFGNHDIFDYKDYARVGFEKMMGYRVIDGFIFSHIPIHHSNLGRFKANIHGHLHSHIVKLDNGHPDGRYYNAGVERNNYTPIALEELKKLIARP